MAFLDGFHLHGGAGLYDFAMGLHIKKRGTAVGHGKAGLAHGAQEGLGNARSTDWNFLDCFGGGGCGFQIRLEHGGPAFGQKRNQVLACDNGEY